MTENGNHADASAKKRLGIVDLVRQSELKDLIQWDEHGKPQGKKAESIVKDAAVLASLIASERRHIFVPEEGISVDVPVLGQEYEIKEKGIKSSIDASREAVNADNSAFALMQKLMEAPEGRKIEPGEAVSYPMAQAAVDSFMQRVEAYLKEIEPQKLVSGVEHCQPALPSRREEQMALMYNFSS